MTTYLCSCGRPCTFASAERVYLWRDELDPAEDLIGAHCPCGADWSVAARDVTAEDVAMRAELEMTLTGLVMASELDGAT